MLFKSDEDVKSAGLIVRQARKVALTNVVQMTKDFQCQTMEGLVQGKAGDYLAIGVAGEVWPIAKDIFEKSYEFVELSEDDIPCMICGVAQYDCTCPRCSGCATKLGEDVGGFGPDHQWIEEYCALYPWRGEYWCDFCLDEEFSMLERDKEDGSVTFFFVDEHAMPKDLILDK